MSKRKYYRFMKFCHIYKLTNQTKKPHFYDYLGNKFLVWDFLLYLPEVQAVIYLKLAITNISIFTGLLMKPWSESESTSS